ncbi:MAG: hypothetical protein FJ106_03640 [Deltaproteobacteria bacterium]|nr:hypothetical protein [Deltaproteobacteria bacterium]
MERVQDPGFRKDAIKIATEYDIEVSYRTTQEPFLRRINSLGEGGITKKLGDAGRAKIIWAQLIGS